MAWQRSARSARIADIRKTLVVMVTARSQDEDFRTARRHGADGHIVKLLSTLEVLDRVRYRLQRAP